MKRLPSEAIDHITKTRARHWPVDAYCPCDGGPCSRYLSDNGRTCKTYVCLRCRKRYPYCFGADDVHSPLCDTCANEIRGTEEALNPRWLRPEIVV